jgi:hypothetical protein
MGDKHAIIIPKGVFFYKAFFSEESLEKLHPLKALV